MMARRPALPQRVVEHAEQLLRLHELIRQGLCNSESADSVRDELDVTWYSSTAEEQRFYGNMSIDLYTIEDELEPDPPAGSDDAREVRDRRRAATDPVERLGILRDASGVIPHREAAEARAEAYGELGLEFIAQAFREHAKSQNQH